MQEQQGLPQHLAQVGHEHLPQSRGEGGQQQGGKLVEMQAEQEEGGAPPHDAEHPQGAAFVPRRPAQGPAPADGGAQAKSLHGEHRAVENVLPLRQAERAGGEHIGGGEGTVGQQHVPHPEVQEEQPLTLPPGRVQAHKQAAHEGGNRQHQVHHQDAVAHGVAAAAQPEHGNAHRPDHQEGQHLQQPGQALAAFYGVGGFLDVVEHGIVPFQQLVETDAVQVAEADDAEHVGQGPARLPVGDGLPADAHRFRHLLLGLAQGLPGFSQLVADVHRAPSSLVLF